MNEKLLKSIEGKKKELDKYRPFSSTIAEKLKEQFILEWTYNSNAIEGNTLTLKETEVVLKHGITIGGKSVNEHLEAINHKEGIIYLETIIQKKKELNEEVIQKIHRIILKGIDDLEAGIYRKQNVRIVGAMFIPPQAIKVKNKVEELIEQITPDSSIEDLYFLAKTAKSLGDLLDVAILDKDGNLIQ